MKVEFAGGKELERALLELSVSAGKGVLRRVGRAALQPMDKAWRERAPHLTGQLEESGSVGSKLSRSQRAAHERESSIEIFAGPGPNPQAIQQEFGNEHNPPQPFMRPAWEATKDEALEIVKRDLWTEIQKAAARAAKKALKAMR